MANAKKTVVVSSYDDALMAIDGHACTVDGVHGRIRVSAHGSAYAHRHRVEHVTSARGKRSPEYVAMRARLRDDYVTDITYSDRLIEIMTAAGIVFVPKESANA
jgi:hypothetical protein